MAQTIRFHFLDVGDGDCTLIEFPSERIGLIDIHTNHDHAKETIDYIKRILGKRDIFRFILTHPHKDHLHGIKDLVDAKVSILNFWHTEHNFEPEEPKDENEIANWKEYEPHWNTYKSISNKHIFSKEEHNVSYLTEDNIEVLSPSTELNKQAKSLENANDAIHRNNYVIKISHGKFMALLCADADIASTNHILEIDTNKIENCVLLKAPHHGTDVHWNEDFVKKCSPKITILFQGEERSKNSAEANYAKIPNNVLGITKKHGVIVIDGKEDGTYSVVTFGSYQDVLNKLGK